MLDQVIWSSNRTYRTGENYEPLEFYINALTNSKSFDLLLGYFSFSAIHILSLSFAQFIANGGRMRVVANNILSEKDRDAIRLAEEPGVLDDLIDFSDIRYLKSSLDEYGQHFFECMAWMIANERIEIILIKPKGKKGIAHYKDGVFSDGENKLAFSASCNFTAYGLVENYETLNLFLGWDDEDRFGKVSNQEKTFDKIFNGKDKNFEYIPAKDVELALHKNFGNKDLNDLLAKEKDLNDFKRRTTENKRLERVIKKTEKRLDRLIKEPRFPYPSGPRDYQIEAYKNWIVNDKKGIFAMATGTGKTLTSLNCLLQEYRDSASYKAVITVPTVALVNQWKYECEAFNFQNIITVSSRQKWEDRIAFYNTASSFIDTNFIIIITYASFYRKKFQEHLKQLSDDTILIADEAHNLGAGKVSTTLKDIHLQKRIGLSATIKRKYDDEGNRKIEEFFNDNSPYTYEYSMQMALDKGWLTEYKYFPHIVELNKDEYKAYIELSVKLMKFFDSSTGKYKDSPEVEALQLARKRIIHKAKNKLAIYRSILNDEYYKRGNLKYTLVYVPEGIDPDYLENDDSEEDEDDMRLIHQYTREVSDVNFGVMVKQYTSKSKGKEEVLKDFASGELHVLTSMKCLDEGVDVPRSELAIFCSSTGNPRQFIQRRGRVLRLAKGKNMATIHDLVVVPKVDKNEGYYNMEKSLFSKELERVVDFAFMAINKHDTYKVFEELLDYYNLNLNDINDKIAKSN